jgi:hypothetical protein
MDRLAVRQMAIQKAVAKCERNADSQDSEFIVHVISLRFDMSSSWLWQIQLKKSMWTDTL